MIDWWETLRIRSLIVGGKLNREVSHGSYSSTSSRYYHCGHCFLPRATQRLQITEVKASFTQLAHIYNNSPEKQCIGASNGFRTVLCPPFVCVVQQNHL